MTAPPPGDPAALPPDPYADSNARERGAPVGRRVILGMLGLGAAGVLVGEHVQQVISSALRPINSAGGLLPGGGGFTLYTVVGGFPAPPPHYRLRVTGKVERPLSLTVQDLEALPATRLTRDFQCVTGWRVDGVHWAGVRLTDLVGRARPSPRAKVFGFSSFDGVYTESLTWEQAQETEAIVAYSMLGRPITRAHGGPVRLYVPGMFGYK
ncbi:MAG: molybdopterin-dependent oxidoreductase, partial [Acidimicrobiales bacterium]